MPKSRCRRFTSLRSSLVSAICTPVLSVTDQCYRATYYFAVEFKKHLGRDKNFGMLPATPSWRIRPMSNRRFEMYDYRQIIHRIRMGQTDREIARTKIIGKAKCGQISAIAQDQGWLATESPLPADITLSSVFIKKSSSNPTHESKCQNHEEQIRTWLACHHRVCKFFGGVPRKMIIDNSKCAITRACYHDPEVQRPYGEMAEGYGFVISPCPPREPRKDC